MGIEEQNKQALNNQQYFADWPAFTMQRRGTILGEFQKLDRLQGIKKICLPHQETIKTAPHSINEA